MSLTCCLPYPVHNNAVIVSADERYDVDPDLRGKFLGLAAIKLWLFAPIQMTYRLYDVATLGFYKRGKIKADHAHISLMRGDPSQRGRAVSVWKILDFALPELLKSIAIFVLYLPYIVALALTSVFGIACPQTARRIFSRIDESLYVHPQDPTLPASTLEQWGNLAAPCMQTKEFRKEMSLFRYAPSKLYHLQSYQSLRARLTKLITKASCYFGGEALEPLRRNLMRLIPTSQIADAVEARELHAGRTPRLEERTILRGAINSLEAAIFSFSRSAHGDAYIQSLHEATSVLARSGALPTVNFDAPFQILV